MWFGLSVVLALLQAWAAQHGWRTVRFFAKPGVMVALLAWLWSSVGLGGIPQWFAAGLLFSLAGDVFLLWPERGFLSGLLAFLLAHVAYIVGFNTPASIFSGWGIFLAVIVGVGSARLLRRVIQAVEKQGKGALRIPIAVYGLVISLMLLSAMLKLMDISWQAGAASLVAGGAALFYFSDVVLAWNRFVSPIKNGQILNNLLYHAGQMALIAGVIWQFR
ncbi:MAG: lysoplasmalogenase [Anaerolineae bacterium]